MTKTQQLTLHFINFNDIDDTKTKPICHIFYNFNATLWIIRFFLQRLLMAIVENNEASQHVGVSVTLSKKE